MTVQTSLTHTESDQPGGAARWFAPNNNFALDQVSVYYAGRIAPNLGAFIQGTYDGVARVVSIDNTDIRYAREFEFFSIEGVGGIHPQQQSDRFRSVEFNAGLGISL